jgi:hypothetical protein
MDVLDEDPFADSDEWIAAEGRQLFRALTAYDPKAIEVCLVYLGHYLVKTLGRHLRAQPEWDAQTRWLDGLVDVDFEAELPWLLRIKASLVWGLSSNPGGDQWQEPFEFELHLWPRTGALRGYRFRFADRRPLAEKLIGLQLEPSLRMVYPPPVDPQQSGGWLVEVCRGELGAEPHSQPGAAGKPAP